MASFGTIGIYGEYVESTSERSKELGTKEELRQEELRQERKNKAYGDVFFHNEGLSCWFVGVVVESC